MGEMSADEIMGEQLSVGQTLLERYRVEACIARGGHSIVYLGVDMRLERPVCIKSFSKLDGKKGVRATVYEHFIQEAFALSSLSHPNTLRIYDFGYLDHAEAPVPFQVSEFMAGGTLASWVKERGRLPAREALPIVCKIADALGEAHERRLIHRDIKPQNILFTTTGADREPKLADFGIAKSIDRGAMNHQADDTQLVAGCPLAMYSPAWAAPEQLCGSPASPAADIYSLGLVTLFAVTGTVLFPSKKAQQAYDKRVAGDRLIRELLHRYEIETAVADAIMSACRFEVRERVGSVRSFGAALRSALDAPMLLTKKRELTGERDATAQLVGASHRELGALLDAEAGHGAEAPIPFPLPAPPPSVESPPGVPRTVPSSSRARGSDGYLDRHCVYLPVEGQAMTLQLAQGRLQISQNPAAYGQQQRSLTIKGLSSFVSPRHGRPSSALVINSDADIDLVTPNKQVQEAIRVLFGQRIEHSRHFQLGAGHLAVDQDVYPNSVVIDDPQHRTSYVLYGFGDTPLTRN